MMPSLSADTWPRIAVSGVRSSCDTDMRKFRDSCSDSASFAAMSREARREMRDLVGAARRRQLDAVVPRGHLVRRLARAGAAAR